MDWHAYIQWNLSIINPDTLGTEERVLMISELSSFQGWL